MTKQIRIGAVPVGGGAPVAIQSMCNTRTDDVAATVEQKSVDGDGNQRQEVAGGEETIRRPEEAEQDTCGLRSLKKFPKSHPWVYISRPCRCDRVEQLGGTEMQNRKRLLQLGVTEKFKSVAPRLKT